MATRPTCAKGLEACPLCGRANARVAEVTRTYGGGGTRYAVACSNRSCRLSAVPRWDQCMETEADARAQWNRWSRCRSA